MWYESPLLITPLTLLTGAGVAFFVSWLSSRKQQVELNQREAAQQAELRALKLQAEIDEQRRIAAEQARLELLAIAQRAAQAATLEAISLLASRQDAMNVTVDKTHELTNSSRTAMEKIEQGLRAELRAAELAVRNGAILADAEFQALKNQKDTELAAKTAELADVQRQMTTMALQIIPARELGATTVSP